MSQVQQPLADGNVGSGRSCTGSSDDGSTRVSASRKAELEVLVIKTFHTLLLPVIETLVRKFVREETRLVQERVMASINQNSGSKINHSEPRILQLKFLNKPSRLVLTGTKITGEDGTSVKVALVDVSTGKVVNSGPEALARVEIGVVHLNSDGAEEFNRHTLLLTGDTCVNLKDGIALVDNISFPHKKIYAKKCPLMMGARVVGNFDGTRVRQAKPEPFILEDRRKELYKKHYPPSLSDEVWRLKNIGRGGSFDKRLSLGNIKTVEQFLTHFFTDNQELQKMLGSNMTDKMLNETVEHGLTCKLDNRYVYRPPDSIDGVVYNVVGQAVGVVSDCHYVAISDLPEAEKGRAQKLVVSAFKQGVKLVHYDESCLLHNSSLPVNEPSSSNASVLDSSSFDRYVCSPGSMLTTGQVQNVVGETVEVIPDLHFAPSGDLSATEKGVDQEQALSVSRHGKEVVVDDDASFPETSTVLSSEPPSPDSQVQGSISFGSNGGSTSVMETDTSQQQDICSPTNTGSSRSFERMDSLEQFNACDMAFLQDFLRSCDNEARALRFARKILTEIRRPGHVPKRQRVK